MYHYDIYNRLKNKSIMEYMHPIKENVELFLNDNMCIHLRSLLTVATSYYNNPHMLHITASSGAVHLISIYHSTILVIQLLTKEDYIQDKFNYINNGIIMMPIAFDIILVLLNSTIDHAIPFLFVNILILLVVMIQPFYKLNHIALHILLICQTYYLCLSHSEPI